MAPSLVGSTIGSYVVESDLGGGGMAQVYKARHVHLGSLHALKVLDRELLVHGDIRERFLDEGRIQAQLRHPNIVAVTDLVSEPGVAGLVMEYVEGLPLDDFWRAHPERRDMLLVPVMRQILAGVGAAHARGIVHRDLKPSNVLVKTEPDGSVVAKVLDFGIAKMADAEGKSKTRTGATMGTPAYMSPEQIRGAKEVTVRSDIWSLGVILYELATGILPFEADTEFDTQVAIVNGRFEPPERRVTGLPPTIAAAIRIALAVDPSARFESCRAFGEALSTSEVFAPAPVRPPLPPVIRIDASESPPKSSRNRVLAGVLALVFGGLGLHKFYLGHIGLGFLYLLFCWTYVPMVIALCEAILLFGMSEETFARKYP